MNDIPYAKRPENAPDTEAAPKNSATRYWSLWRGYHRVKLGKCEASQSPRGWREHVLIDDTWIQASFSESKTNADADKLFVSEIEDFSLPNSERL